MPPDPFGPDGAAPDMTQWGAHCRAMYLSLVAAGFDEAQALRFTIDVMVAMMVRKG